MPAHPSLILLVEDEPSLREPLEHLLRLRQFEVVSADTTEAALDLIETCRPDAAIVDLHLRRGSGREVVVRMPPDAPVIIFSGARSASGELERLRPLTMLVEKPCSLTWLIDRLDGLLARGIHPSEIQKSKGDVQRPSKMQKAQETPQQMEIPGIHTGR